MGKHAAPEGSAAHPLVAAALARRQSAMAGSPEQDDGAARDGAVGWPGPPPGDSRVGWPSKDAAEDSARADSPAAVPPQRGWRRFFRVRAAA